MDELDEYGRPAPQKITAGDTVGFPLRKFGIGLQWTRTALMIMLTTEIAAQTVAAMDADTKVIQREIRRAIFTPTNIQFIDRLVDSVTLPVKRLLNADGSAIPLGPNGEVFNGATHTHYLFTTGVAVAAADMNALLETVIEHQPMGQALVYINRVEEAAVRALAGFTAYLDARLVGATTATQATTPLDYRNVHLNDRAIGVYSAGGVSAEIHVKPWIPAGYLFAWVQGAPPPLVMRTRTATSGNLELVYEDENHPLRAKAYEREMGVAAWTRTNGAVLYIDTGNTDTYVAPTIN